MKAQNNIKEIKVYGHLVLMDIKKEEIIFPDDSLTQEEIENIACYLSEEGFTERYFDSPIK
jgi:hypothetical protein